MYKDLEERYSNIDESSTLPQIERIHQSIDMLRKIEDFPLNNRGSHIRSEKFKDVDPVLLTKREASDLIGRLIVEQRNAKREQLVRIKGGESMGSQSGSNAYEMATQGY